jgi:hypothetical protein
MPSDDPKFERALAQHLRGGSARANCPDAETLAAYHERNLSLEEMARWKEHISACEACQEALALVETTENQLAEDWEERGVPVMEAASLSRAEAGRIPRVNAKAEDSNVLPQTGKSPVAILRRRPALLRWAIPVGAVAAGVLVFIGIYEQRTAKVARYSDTVITRRQEPANSAPMVAGKINKMQSELESKNERAATDELSRKEKDQELLAKALAKAMERPKVADDKERGSGNAMSSGGPPVKKSAATPPPAPNLPLQSSADSSLAENAPVVAGAPRPAPPASMAYGGAVGGAVGEKQSRADAKSAPAAATESVTAESAVPQLDTTASTTMMKQGVARQKAQVTGSSAGLILTPDNKVFWKLQPGGTVQLTTDGGKNWKAVEIAANAELISGFAPSSRICWIAGKAGALVLTTDRGRHWTRISTPILGDLGGVHADDEKHASIWDAAKQTSYETSDGGATWEQTASK